jgi:NAD(P)-dependent dehydrogenase (short-subunit alcohol dehydrogenase family)
MTSVAKGKGISVAEAEKDYFEKSRPESIIRRFAEPSEIASLVAHVASPLSAVTNGASLRAEGGIVHSIG